MRSLPKKLPQYLHVYPSNQQQQLYRVKNSENSAKETQEKKYSRTIVLADSFLHISEKRWLSRISEISVLSFNLFS